MLCAAEMAHPGFINLRVADGWISAGGNDSGGTGHVWRQRAGQGSGAGRWSLSANPTGPLHFGGARNVCLGDAVADVLAAAAITWSASTM